MLCDFDFCADFQRFWDGDQYEQRDIPCRSLDLSITIKVMCRVPAAELGGRSRTVGLGGRRWGSAAVSVWESKREGRGGMVSKVSLISVSEGIVCFPGEDRIQLSSKAKNKGTGQLLEHSIILSCLLVMAQNQMCLFGCYSLRSTISRNLQIAILWVSRSFSLPWIPGFHP